VAHAVIAAAQVFHTPEQADEHRAGATNGPAHAPRTDHRPVRRTASLTTADRTGKKDD
jgi:hypothetical protein